MLSRCFLDFSVSVRASVIGLSQISSFSPNTGVSSRLSLFYIKQVKSMLDNRDFGW